MLGNGTLEIKVMILTCLPTWLDHLSVHSSVHLSAHRFEAPAQRLRLRFRPALLSARPPKKIYLFFCSQS